MVDFEKLHMPYIQHVAFKGIDLFKKNLKRDPEPWNLQDAEEFYKLCLDPAKNYEQLKDEKRLESVLKLFVMTY